MKKFLLFIVLFLILLSSCSNIFEEDKETDTYTFHNNSSYELIVSEGYGSDHFDSFTFKPGETTLRSLTGNCFTTLFYTYTNDEYVKADELDKTITFTDKL